MSEGIWIKKSLVAAVAAGTLVLAGCNDESTDTKTEGTSTSQETNSNPSNYQTVNNPRGSITGLVTDTNGYPIQGATVYLGEQTATTNAGGQYYFSDVAVTRTVKNDSDEYAQALALTIVAPEGYLGATVTVMPQAQIFNGSGDENEVTNPVTTFVDGFNASAGTAALPATTASVKGTLRHALNGEALAGVRLSLDMDSSSVGVDQEQPQDGVKTTYSTQGITATTSANGEFTFEGVPSDAVLKLAADDYQVSKTIDTSDEHSLVALGTVSATPVLSLDTISPWVESVTQVIDQNASRGMLNDDVTTTLTVKFNETMQDVDPNSLRVRDVTDAAYLGHSASLSGNILTVTLDTAVPADHDIDLLLLTADFKDTSSNALGVVDKDGDPSLVGFDETMSATTGAQYVRLKLKSFIEANDNAQQVSAFTQESTDETGVDELELAQAKNHAFLDINDDVEGIQQLNANDEGGATQSRLKSLLTTIKATASLEGTADVEVDSTLVHFTPTNASAYRVEVRDSEGNDKWTGLSAKELKGLGELENQVDNNGDPLEYALVTADGSNDVELYLDGVVPGDQVVVTPLDDFGYDGTPTVLTLVDNVAPTTVLQDSYGVGNKDNGQVTTRRYGNGGETSSDLDVVVGTPYYDLTPRLFGEVDGTDSGSEDDKNYIESFERLYSLNTVNPEDSSNDSGTAEGEEFINPTNNVYDKNALTAYLGQADYFARTMGVAFSENLSETLDGTPVFTAVAGNELPVENSYKVLNDVVKDDNGDDNENNDVDLVTFDLTNIYKFALEEDGSVFDFTGVVSDLEGNEATEEYNAKVVVRDMIPPMVVSAVYEGDVFIVEFDKPIDISAIDGPETAMSLNGVDIDLSDVENYDWDEQNLTLTVKRHDNNKGAANDLGYGQFHLGDTFDLAQYNDDAPEASVASDGLKHKHAKLDFSKIPNKHGATWAFYNDNSADKAGTSGYFEAPQFAVQNKVESFSVQNDSVNVAEANGVSTITVHYTFEHEVDWSGEASGETLTATEVADLFTFTDVNGDVVEIDTSSSNTRMNITEKSDGAVTYSFTLVMTGVVEGGVDTLDLKELFSAYNSDADAKADATSITL
ncbi:carboxypeptidase-like regulatory domain-containing protein [Saccharospirillum salsuginis]|uniref:Uncharacterized protein n=1 Tax=Saccharospirillum salsuginis TaxID=418750 RepID=A0A918NKF0_9GAMM|nr:carboxypeptidase-like regulatory domain-containing protein [Saccharospirillum salsuginis]GGX74805.1 hypothetical protein GCM10007392_47600 [Saccharospirillum salsuginis]